MSNTSFRPHILRPYIAQEAAFSHEVATMLNKKRNSIVKLAHREGIGRIIGKDMMISRVALQLYLEDERELLAAYLAGDRDSEEIRSVYSRLGIALPAAQLIAAE